jgi:hypothetical protein
MLSAGIRVTFLLSIVLTVLSGQVREKRVTPVSIEEKQHFEWQRRMGVAFLVGWHVCPVQ